MSAQAPLEIPPHFKFLDRSNWVLFNETEAKNLKLVPVVRAEDVVSVDSFDVHKSTKGLKTQYRQTKPEFMFRTDHNATILDFDVLAANPTESVSLVKDIVGVTKRFVFMALYPAFMLHNQLASIKGQLKRMSANTGGLVKEDNNVVNDMRLNFALSIRAALVPSMRMNMSTLHTFGVMHYGWSDDIARAWVLACSQFVDGIDAELASLHKQYNETEKDGAFVGDVQTLLGGLHKKPYYKDAIQQFKSVASKTMFTMRGDQNMRSNKIDAIYEIFENFTLEDPANEERLKCTVTDKPQKCTIESAAKVTPLRILASSAKEEKAYFF